MPIGHLYVFFREISVYNRSSDSFFNWAVWICLGCLLLRYMNCLHILEIKPMLVTLFGNIFSQSVGCLFILFMASFAVQKFISLIRWHRVFFSIAFEDWSKKTLVQFMSENVFPLSFLGVGWCHLIFEPESYFEFIFVYGVRDCSNFTDLHAAVQISQHQLLKVLFFLCGVFLTTWSKISSL